MIKVLAIILFGLLSVFSSPTFSQIRIGASFSTYASFIHFDDAPINRGLRITPAVLHSLSLVAREPLTSRLFVQAGIGYTNVGYRTVEVIDDYIGNRRFEQVGIGVQKNRFYQIPVKLTYTFPKHGLYAQLGCPILLSFFDPSIPVVFRGSGISGTITGRNSVSATLLTGFGIERKLGKQHAINIGLVYNLGFVPIVTWEIKYQADNRNYVNAISSRNSYIGINLTYWFLP